MEENQVESGCELLVIAGSAGSLEVILSLLPNLVMPLRIAIVIVIHRKYVSNNSLTNLFSYKTAIPVLEIEDKEPITAGTIYVAPVDYHLLIEREKTFALDLSGKVNYSRPSIDLTFTCAAEVYGNKLVCLLLSGANADGTKGLKEVAQQHGKIAVQAPESAKVAFMPAQAIRSLTIDYVLQPEEMADFINGL